MHISLKRLAPLVLTNLLALASGYVLFRQQTQLDKVVLVAITPHIGKQSFAVEGVNIEKISKEAAHQRIGKPIETINSYGDVQELLDNVYMHVVWAPDWQPPFSPKIYSAYFDLENIAAKYKTKLCLTLKYKGKTYLLDEAITPDVLKASFPDAKLCIVEDPRPESDPVFSICNDSIEIRFQHSKIASVYLLTATTGFDEK